MDADEVRGWFADQFEMTADWRGRKAAQYPDDRRNEDAVLLLELQRQARHIDEGVAAAYAQLGEDAEALYRVLEIEQEMLREVGFRSEPPSVTEFVSMIVEQMRSESEPPGAA